MLFRSSNLEENECDLIFLIDYFGFLSTDIREFAEMERSKGKLIIYDATHAMFCENQDYMVFDYVFGSFRKWTGINAGFAAKHGKWVKKPVLKHNKEYEKLRNASFDLKEKYICNPDSVDKSEYLSCFQLAEEMLETDYQNYSPDVRSRELVNNLDVSRIRDLRRRNAEQLIMGLMSCKELWLPYSSIKQDECPLFIPAMIKTERNSIRKYLIDHSIYLPVHWPISSLHCLKTETRTIYDEEVSFVCDQRYDVEDMKHIVEVIKQND